MTEKELAAYLPYELKVKLTKKGLKCTPKSVLTLQGIVKEKDELVFWLEDLTGYTNRIYEIKPVLFPLSMLIQEITINGETFVTIEKLFEIKYPEHSAKGIDYYIENVPNWVLCSGNWTAASFKFYLNSVDDNYHWAIQKLLEWKFDIFGLIEKGDAIAVTNEFNPYK